MRIGNIIDTQVKPVNWSVGSSKDDMPIRSFSSTLRDAMDYVKHLHAVDEKNTELLATGEADNLHKIMIDAEKADIAMQLMLQTRNKAIEAYQEIMRMQI